MASANNMVSPIPNWRKEEAYNNNGWDPKAHPSDFGMRFVQRPKKDVGDVKIDPEVHGMVSANNMISPIPNWRKEEAYKNNGSEAHLTPDLDSLAKFAQKPRKDIGEGGIDAEVHGMASANNMVSPIPNWRKEEAYNNNGWDPKAHPSDFIAKPRRDIGDK